MSSHAGSPIIHVLDSDSPKSLRSNRGTLSKSSSLASDQLSLNSFSQSPAIAARKKHNGRKRVSSADTGQEVTESAKHSDSTSLKSSERSGSNHSTYILILTSNDRLELTVTPSALRTIMMYSNVSSTSNNKFFHVWYS